MGCLAYFLGKCGLAEEDSQKLEEAYIESGVEGVRRVSKDFDYYDFIHYDDDDDCTGTGEFVEMVEDFVNREKDS